MNKYIVSETIYVVHDNKVCEGVILDVENYPGETIYKVRLWTNEVLLFIERGIYCEKQEAEMLLKFQNRIKVEGEV